MSNINVQNRPVQTVTALPATPKTEKTEQAAPQQSQMQQDVATWSTTAKGTRVKAAMTESFKETAIPYTIGGALAVPVGSALVGGFFGLFAGDPMGGAKIAVKATAKYIPVGAAVGLGVSGAKSAVVGTVVGTAPNKESAAVRMGTLTAVVGVLTAEEPEDLIGVAAGTAYDASMAARIFDKAEARIQQQQ